MSTMDVKGYRRLRTLSQLTFEHGYFRLYNTGRDFSKNKCLEKTISSIRRTDMEVVRLKDIYVCSLSDFFLVDSTLKKLLSGEKSA